MRVVCPNCGTSVKHGAAAGGAGQREKIQCGQCRAVFAPSSLPPSGQSAHHSDRRSAAPSSSGELELDLDGGVSDRGTVVQQVVHPHTDRDAETRVIAPLELDVTGRGRRADQAASKAQVSLPMHPKAQSASAGYDGDVAADPLPTSSDAVVTRPEIRPASLSPYERSHWTQTTHPALKVPPGSVALAVNRVVSVACLVLLAGGIVYFVAGTGVLPTSWSNFRAESRLHSSGNATQIPEARIATWTSSVFRADDGRSLLVWRGELENRSQQPMPDLDVVGELVDPDTGSVVATARSPAGVVLEPGQLARITDATALPPDLAPASIAAEIEHRVPFMVVLRDPPSDLRRLVHTVRLDVRLDVRLEKRLGSEAAAPGAAAPAGLAGEAATAESSPEDRLEPSDAADAAHGEASAKRKKHRRRTRRMPGL